MTDHKKQAALNWQAFGRIWSMLPARFKGAAVRLWLLMILGALLEMLGVGLIIPVITMLTQPDVLTRHATLNGIYEYVGQPSQQSLVIMTMLLLLAVYLLKNLYLGLLAWKQSKFIFNLQHELSTRLFAIYMRQPYSFHLQRNSAHLVRNLQGEMAMFINSAVTPTTFILTESLVVFGLFVMLLLVEPIGSVAVFGILFIAASAYQKITKHRVARWGRQRLIHEGARIKQLHHGLGGVKDAKLLGREADFLEQYDEHTRQSMRMNQRQSVMQQVPRLWLELLAIAALAILLISMTVQGKSILAVLPTLALFAAASFRLMPSANRILSGIQQLRFGLPVVDMLYHELNLSNDISDGKIDPITFENSVVLEHISYTYPAAKVQALHDVNLTIHKGEMIGFIGESGSGKSTLIDIVLGLLRADVGRIMIDGKDMKENLRAWQSQIGYVPQTIYLTDDTLRRNVAFGLGDADIDDASIDRALKAAQLEELVKGLPDGVHTIVGERGVRLSGGQRQRIGIARALYHDPGVLVLDEATSALDTETEAEVMKAVVSLQGEKTILIVAHRLTTVERCDRVIRLKSGKLDDQEQPCTNHAAVNQNYWKSNHEQD